MDEMTYGQDGRRAGWQMDETADRRDDRWAGWQKEYQVTRQSCTTTNVPISIQFQLTSARSTGIPTQPWEAACPKVGIQ